MKIFIWENIEKLTDNWHSNGGLVVIAENITRAKELAREKGVKFGKGYTGAITHKIDAIKEKVYIFENAGCC